MSTPPHPALVPLTYIVSIVGLTVNSPAYRYASFILIFGLFAHLLNHGMPVAQHLTATNLSTLFFTMSGLLALSNPHELRMVGQKQPTDELPVLGRIKWAVMLFISPRLVGWTAEPTFVLPPRSRRTSRLGFAAEQLVHLVCNLLVTNVATMVIEHTPEFRSNGPRLSNAPWLLRSLYCLTFAIASSSAIKMSHEAWVLVLLATGRWSPSEFAPIMGTWSNAYTLRKFWGHNQATALIELYSAFFISGLFHYTTEYFIFQNWSSGAIRFFILQAVAIHLEGIVIDFASSRLGSKQNKMWEVIGYIWVLQWFTWSLPIWIEPQINGGIIENGAKIQVIQTLCFGHTSNEHEHPNPESAAKCFKNTFFFPLTSLVPLTFLVSIVGLTVNSPTHRHTSFVLILGLFASAVYHGMPLAEQPTAVVLSIHFFAMSNFLALSNPHELRMVDQTQPTDELSVFARIRWAVMLLVSPRLVGWTVEPTTALPPRSRRTSRLLFAAEQLASLAFNIVVMNIATMAIDRTPEFQLNGPKFSNAPDESNPPKLDSSFAGDRSVVPFGLLPVLWDMGQCVYATQVLGTYLAPTAQTRVSSFFLYTGGPAVLTSSKMLTAHARFVSQKLLGLPRHSKVRTYLELYIAFFISGLLHYSLEYMSIKNWANGAIQFFTLQAVAIHLEDMVIAFASSRLGLKQNKMWEAIGYIWVVQWFGWSLPMWLEPRIRGGAVDNVPRVRIVETVCLYALERCPLV
ncbi:hypothetical protein ONZ45_g8609 [Pleurotus djamor]|nr:hypothetical protein ONZ45_g8609 [Pleurotus djamor]